MLPGLAEVRAQLCVLQTSVDHVVPSSTDSQKVGYEIWPQSSIIITILRPTWYHTPDRMSVCLSVGQAVPRWVVVAPHAVLAVASEGLDGQQAAQAP
jgi:hypothetical protein